MYIYVYAQKENSHLRVVLKLCPGDRESYLTSGSYIAGTTARIMYCISYFYSAYCSTHLLWSSLMGFCLVHQWSTSFWPASSPSRWSALSPSEYEKTSWYRRSHAQKTETHAMGSANVILTNKWFKVRSWTESQSCVCTIQIRTNTCSK